MTPADLVARALTMRDQGEYQLGTGNYTGRTPDVPWTRHHKTGLIGADCAGFAVCWAHRLRRHRPGFGRGGPVVDDINSDSVLYDARHNHELFVMVDGPPIAGDLLIIPSRFDANGRRVGIGHVLLVTGNRALEWDRPFPWHLVDVVQCRGPNGKRPGVIVSTAAVCGVHDAKWLKKPEMQTAIVRCRPDVLAAL